MTFAVDLFCSFRSPYSYLAIRQLASLRRTWAFDIAPRIVLPIAVRDAERYARLGPAADAYMKIDAPRVAEMLGLPYGAPNPDPVAVDPLTRTPMADQAQIQRLSRLGAAAAEMGRGLSFFDEVISLIWSGAPWAEGDALADAAARAGLNLEDLERAVARTPERFDAAIADNAKALAEAGHWGVPTMVYDGEAFFGQDRIPVLLWRLKQKGLTPRQ